jgi:hypothetical protein
MRHPGPVHDGHNSFTDDLKFTAANNNRRPFVNPDSQILRVMGNGGEEPPVGSCRYRASSGVVPFARREAAANCVTEFYELLPGERN